MGSANGQSAEAVFGLMFGVGAIIILPLFYGVVGFVVSAIGAAVYNVIASVTGGIEVQLE